MDRKLFKWKTNALQPDDSQLGRNKPLNENKYMIINIISYVLRFVGENLAYRVSALLLLETLNVLRRDYYYYYYYCVVFFLGRTNFSYTF
jgi:hypothetical protein